MVARRGLKGKGKGKGKDAMVLSLRSNSRNGVGSKRS